MVRTRDDVRAAAEKQGWSVSFGVQDGEQYAEFEAYSPAGEDLCFTEFFNNVKDLPDRLYERHFDFDPDEHAVEWYGRNNGEPISLRYLLDDAEAIEEMILELARALDAWGG